MENFLEIARKFVDKYVNVLFLVLFAFDIVCGAMTSGTVNSELEVATTAVCFLIMDMIAVPTYVILLSCDEEKHRSARWHLLCIIVVLTIGLLAAIR